MDLWTMKFALPLQVWLPLGLGLLAPLVVVAVLQPLSRRSARGIATVLALRTVALMAIGFASLAAVAAIAVVQTGMRELGVRHARDVRAIAAAFERSPHDLESGATKERLDLFRARDPSLAFIAAGADGCRATCLLSLNSDGLDPDVVRSRLIEEWPSDHDVSTVTIDGRPYLLVVAPVRDATGQARSLIVAALDAGYIADQAGHTAWLLLGLSYLLLIVVGWSSWQQVSRSLAARIHAINTQLLSGNADESHDGFAVDGQELEELADSVSAYIKRTLEEKSSSDERYRRLVELAPDAILVCVDSKIRSANPAAIRLTGARHRSDVLSSNIDRFLKFDDRTTDAARSDAARMGTWRQLDGTKLHVEVTEITDSIGDELVRQFIVRDVTHSHRREAALTHRADHDSLTGLVNRARFEARLLELLAPGGVGRLRNSSDVAVLFIDLDHFKPVNDTYGHAAGDAVLKAIAHRLQDATRGTDLIARLGGDEFAVLVEVRDAGEADAVAQRILQSLHQPVVVDGASVAIRASIGIATTRPPFSAGPSDACERPMTASEMLKAADAAMYAAKSAGGDRYVSDGMSAQSTTLRAEVRFPAMA